MSSYSNLMSNDVIEPGNHQDSELYDRITRDNADAGDMPPGSNKLSQSEIDLIAQWINGGADLSNQLESVNDFSIIDIYPNEPLKMTDWHWFDWYNRPGVVDRESGTNCCSGWPGRAQAKNKEEIHYKLMAGDTTNLTTEEKRWFFHVVLVIFH